jgi:hypothetical protein
MEVKLELLLAAFFACDNDVWYADVNVALETRIFTILCELLVNSCQNKLKTLENINSHVQYKKVKKKMF